ncbi:MAG: hypothetical protein K9K88_14770, partial [Desulfobacterales bacterium]|nr:hypothetical protein [Desulfobacterales bacterium]
HETYACYDKTTFSFIELIRAVITKNCKRRHHVPCSLTFLWVIVPKIKLCPEASDGGGTRSVASVLPAMSQYRPRRSVALQPPKPKAGAGRLLPPASVEVSHKFILFPGGAATANDENR